MRRKDILFAMLCVGIVVGIISLCDLIAWLLIHINKVSLSLLILILYFAGAALVKMILRKIEHKTTHTSR